MENFLPNDYKMPDSSGYMKFKDGENTFRVLSSAIIGYEYWTNDNKPVRSNEFFEETPNIRTDKDGNPTKIKHFWAFVVYNYNAEAVQILEVTQKTIQGAIKAMVDNKQWGNPKDYDITVTRVGDGFDTEYSVMPNPKSEVDEKIIKAYEAKIINLEKLYTGEDPFATAKEINVDDIN